MPEPDRFAQFIEIADIAGALSTPLADSIEDLLRVSAAEINAAEASVLVREGADGDLRFLAAIGKVAEQLRDMKIPAGKGIAGFVLSSGQPMAVSDAAEEESFYAEIDKQTGYSTQMILATPLRFKDEIIGVLEYINRPGDPPYRPFTPAEMDNAAVFGEAIAALVNAHESADLLQRLGEKILAEGGIEMRTWLDGLRVSSEHRETLDLAVLLRELANRGDAERRMCREVLEAILNYSQNRLR